MDGCLLSAFRARHRISPFLIGAFLFLLGARGWAAGATADRDALTPAASTAAVSLAFSTAVLTCQYLEFSSSESVVIARGNAVLISSSTRLVADELHLFIARRTAVADGHVLVQEGASRLLADHAVYDWGAASGTLTHAYIEEKPWRIWAGELERQGPNFYRLRRAVVAGCGHTPPHYHVRATSGWYRPKDRVTLYNDRLALGNDPVFYTPVFTHAFKDNAWTFTVDPGHSARDGYFAKMMFQYPVSEHTRARLRWDAFQNTGNGWGAEYEYGLPQARGRASGYYLDDRLTGQLRWSGRLVHWQALSPRLSLQANAAVQSDTDVNNLYARDDYMRVRQDLSSDAALTYQAPNYTARVAVEHDRIYDAVQGRFVSQKVVLPNATLQTSPLALGKTGVYFTGNVSATNQYIRPQTTSAPNPIDPEKDLFQMIVNGGGNLTKRFRVARDITLEPSAGLTQTWQSWRAEGTTIDRNGYAVGRPNARINWRQRLTDRWDYDLTESYVVRWRPNTMLRDHAAPDGGVEKNDLSFFGSYRAGSAAWARITTAYDFRSFPQGASPPPRARITPPSLELNLRPRRDVRVFARETVQVYPARKPQATQLDGTWAPAEKTALSSGISYNIGRPGELDVYHAASFFLSRGWWLDGSIYYTAAGSGGVNYNQVTVREKNLVLRRDLHCWVLRVVTKFRPGVEEIFFRLEMKSGMEKRQSAELAGMEQFRQGREQLISE